MTSAASRRSSRRRRINGAHDDNSLALHCLGPSHFLAIRSFSLRFALASTHHGRRKRRLGDARQPAPASRRPLRESSRRSIFVPRHFPALRPFVLRYVLATGALALCRRRKASLIDMGNYASRLLRKSTSNGGLGAYKGWVEGSREIGDLTVATKAEVDEANAVRRGIADASKITLEVSHKDELESPKQDLSELFIPLTNEEESEVNNFLYGSGHSTKTIVMHKPSNIEITKEKLWCLRPRGWLNDEVINVYLALLKERVERGPNRFLKCHFFNTFFYGKLAGGKAGYDYQSVRRWTTLEKLGYGLVECDKIFVPIHRGIHWCLAVINMKDKTFQYLDSLGGMDCAVLRILARYIVDELKNKSNIEIDTSSWLTLSDHVPSQQNRWDCGMFMLKFIDFHTRGLRLSFSQEHMEYFRKRTAKEILRLRAD